MARLWDTGTGIIGPGRFSHLQPEQGREIATLEHLGWAWRWLCQRKVLSGTGEQVMFVHVAQHKQKLGLFVESGPNAIQSRCNVLAHVGPVRTAAGQFDFLWRRKQAVALPTNPIHDALR